MDFLYGTLLLYFAWTFLKHFQRPAEASQRDIRMMSMIIMVYTGGYGTYRMWLAFGGAPFGGF